METISWEVHFPFPRSESRPKVDSMLTFTFAGRSWAALHCEPFGRVTVLVHAVELSTGERRMLCFRRSEFPLRA